jgi:hypothetical protein
MKSFHYSLVFIIGTLVGVGVFLIEQKSSSMMYDHPSICELTIMDSSNCTSK